MDTLVKMDGVPEQVIEMLLDKGYYKTKAETLRAGVLGLGEKYGLFRNPEDLELNLVALKIKKEEKALKKKETKFLSEAEVKKKYGFK